MYVPELSSKKMLESRQEKEPEPPPLGLRFGQIAAIEEHGEKPLGQIFGLGRWESLPADVGIQRIPVKGAQRFERVACRGRFLPGGGHHESPPRGREAPRLRHQCWGTV